MTDADVRESPILRRTLVLVVVVLVIASLYWAREVLIPLTLAAFVSLLLAPVVRQLERIHLGRVLSVLLSVVAAFTVIALAGWLVVAPASQLAHDFQQYRNRIGSKISALRTSVAHATGGLASALETITGDGAAARRATPKAADTDPPATLIDDPESGTSPMTESAGPPNEPVRVEVVRTRHDLIEVLGRYVNPLVSPLVTGGITVVFCIFFLIHREDLRDRILRLAGRAQINVTTAALVDTAQRVTRYVAAQAVTNAVIGGIIALGLYLMGIPNALLWGLLGGVLRFAPYVGVFIASAFPVAQAIAVFDGWGAAIGVLVFIVAVDAIFGNLVEPWFYGSQIGASPTALLLSFMLWTWLWGGIGLVLATPITVCLVVLGKHTPAFEIFYILLGDEPVLEPAIRFYQRLLAQDRREAVRVAQEYAAQNSPTEAYAQVILPGLAQLERDRCRGLLEPARVEFARQIVRELLESLRPKTEETPGVERPESASTGSVIVVLDRGAFDDLLPEALAQAAELPTNQLTVLTQDSLATDIVAKVNTQRPSAVVLCAIEPRDTTRLRHILKRLRAEQPDIPVHLAVFTITGRARAMGGLLQSGLKVHESLASLAEALRGMLWVRPAAAAPAESASPPGDLVPAVG
jgi:predicted PurR-regulated permease PerM